MQVMAQVTVELSEEQEDELDTVEDIAEEDTVVGRILEEEGDSKNTENWKKLVRKLSNKQRKKNLKKKGEKRPERETRESESSEEAEDDIPEDWRPDFIPKEWEVGEAGVQPDVVQASLGSLQEPSEDPVTSAMVRFRSDHR